MVGEDYEARWRASRFFLPSCQKANAIWLKARWHFLGLAGWSAFPVWKRVAAGIAKSCNEVTDTRAPLVEQVKQT